MTFLTTDEIIMLHDRLLAATGGTAGLRDRGLLESAVFGIYAGYENVEQYPTLEEKTARLTFSLINNHAFVDGNKRVGILAMLMTLALNDVKLRYTQAELVALGLAVAGGTAAMEEILDWIREHTGAYRR